MLRAALCLGLIGCVGVPSTDDEETGDTDPCPNGWTTASSASMVISDFRVDTLRLQAEFVSTATYAGRPAACIAPDGTAADWLIVVVDEPYARIEAHATVTGGQPLNEGVGTLTVELFGNETPITYTNADWQTGLWSVDQIGATFETTLSGTAVSGGSQFQIVTTAQATR